VILALVQLGLIVNYKPINSGQLIAVFYNGTNLLFCTVNVASNSQSCKVVPNCPSWDILLRKVIKVRFSAISSNRDYYTIYVDNTQLATYSVTSSWAQGNHGVLGFGEAGYDTMFVSTPTFVMCTLTDCSLSDDDILTSISQSLNVPTSNIVGLQRLGCSSKRDISVAQTLTFNLVGFQGQSSSNLASQLKANPPSQFSNIEYTTSPTSTTSDLAGVSTIAVDTVDVVATGLTVGAIVGIAVGGAAGAIAVGSYFGYKKIKENKKNKSKSVSKEELKEEPKVPETTEPENNKPDTYKPKGATVNVFQLDPNNPQSITARSPAINQ